MPSFPQPATVAEAEKIQDELRAALIVGSAPIELPRTVVGLDVTYEVGSARAVAAAVVVDASDWPTAST
uniref:hypothetical protein n=1 Tax=Paractinoplanes polyasparticus TaxID=2856853 RepID=UPI001C857AD1|nr:hypothetical protein [Actinoplanes polyasparticus]